MTSTVKDSDQELWQRYAATLKKTKKKLPAKTEKAKTPMQTGLRQSTHSLPTAPIEPIIPDLTFDRRAEKNLRNGELRLEACLDLHGMTQVEAFDALARFMTQQSKMGHHNLLIITGKGRMNKGVLRTNLRSWLESLPEAQLILALRLAAPKHGGDGAFYVILKKYKG